MTRIVASNGLAGDLEGWQAKGRDAARRYALKQQDKRRTAVVEVTRQGERTVARRTPKIRNDWSEQTRDLARLRSGGSCELCQSAAADHLHHRQPRRGRDHRIVNALHVCSRCHGLIHAEPKRATVCGWIVHSRANAAAVPVVLLGRRVWLTEAGGYSETKPVLS